MTADRNAAGIKQLGQGYYWQDLAVGQRFQTFRRTVTETDIVNFISVTGMLETIFIDATYAHGAIQGRPAPGALTYGLIEGLIMQGMVQGTGLALLEVHKKMLAPVVAGDTIWAEIEVTRTSHLAAQPGGGRLGHRGTQPARQAGDGLHGHAHAGWQALRFHRTAKRSAQRALPSGRGPRH